MQRSPITLLVLLVLVLAATIAVAQSNPATPKPGSGVPEAPVPGTQAPSNSEPQPPPNATDAQPNAVPTPTPASAGKEQPAPAGNAASPENKGKSGSNTNSDNKKTEPAVAPIPAPEPPPANPKTEILDSSATSGALATDGHDPILDPAPVPQTTTTLVGGTISGVDRMRNRLTVAVYGGGHWHVIFDERTHIFHNGAETTQLALKKGERVYVDTQLDNNGNDIFARNIRVGVAAPPADADGQIIAIDSKHSELTLRDTINSVPVRFGIDKETRISNGQTPAVFQDVKPGALVHVRFAAESPNRGLAREINILAAPGANFTFSGRITYLDLHRGVLAIQNTTDDKNYEIHFSPASVDRNTLGVGVEVRVVATFQGAQYAAQNVLVIKGPEAMK